MRHRIFWLRLAASRDTNKSSGLAEIRHNAKQYNQLMHSDTLNAYSYYNFFSES